jgi:hypothetical protein
MSNTVPCFKKILWKYLTILRRSKMSLVLQFELILKIGSIICAYGGRRVGQGWSRRKHSYSKGSVWCVDFQWMWIVWLNVFVHRVSYELTKAALCRYYVLIRELHCVNPCLSSPLHNYASNRYNTNLQRCNSVADAFITWSLNNWTPAAH